MTAEVEKVQGEVEVGIEIEIEHKSAVDVPAYQDLPNGNADADSNANVKDEADGSYVFVTGSDTAPDDLVERDAKGDCTVHVGATAGIEKERENGTFATLKLENGGIGDHAVEENAGGDAGVEDQNRNGVVAVSELQQPDAGIIVGEETEDSPVLVVGRQCQLPLAGDGKADNGEVTNLESIEQVEESQDSQPTIVNPETQEHDDSHVLAGGSECEFSHASDDEAQNGEVTNLESEDQVEETQDSQPTSGNLSGPETQQHDDSQVRAVENVCELPPAGDGEAENGEVSKFELTKHVEDSRESERMIRNLSHPETEEHDDPKSLALESEYELPQAGDSESDNGEAGNEQVEEKLESQPVMRNLSNPKNREHDIGEEEVEEESRFDSPADTKENHVSKMVVSEDVQDNTDQGKQTADLEQEKKSVELTNYQIPLDDPLGDVEVDSEQKLQLDSSHAADVQLESESGGTPISDENRDGLPTDHAPNSVSECVKQETPEENGSSENTEIFATVCDSIATVDLINEPADHGAPRDLEVDADQSSKVELDGPLEPGVHYERKESFPIYYDQDNVKETTVADNGDASQNAAEEAKSLPVTVVFGSFHVENAKSSHTSPNSDEVADSYVEIGASNIVENSEVGATDDVREEAEVVQAGLRCSETADSFPVDKMKEEIEVEIGPTAIDTESSWLADCSKSETETSFPSNDVQMEDEAEILEVVSECAESHPVSVTETEAESRECLSIESDIKFTSADDVKAESEVHLTFGVSGTDMPGNEVPDGSEDNCVPDVIDVKQAGDQYTDGDNDNKTTCQEVDVIDEIQKDGSPKFSREGSAIDASEGQDVVPGSEKRPFYFLIKIPRYDDGTLREQINHAQLQVDQRTKSRDAIQAEIQKTRASLKEHGESFDAARKEESAARESLRSKRQEIDSFQSMINRVKSAISVEDIDSRVRNMEHTIEHETLPLKEEKQLIREMKQLRQLREQFSSSMGRQDEVQQALDQKDQIEERLKSLRKEADMLRVNVQKAEAVTKAAKKNYDEESKKLRQFKDQFKAADDVRQEVYANLQNLKKQLYEKNKYFWSYKEDARTANDLAFKRDTEALQHHCINQVEQVMNLWNNNDEFRQEYIRCNVRSTLRRLKTLDGRALGPDEEAPVIPHALNERVEKNNTVSLVSTPEGEEKQEIVPLTKNREVEDKPLMKDAEDKPLMKDAEVDDKPVMKAGEQKKLTTKFKRPVKSAPPASGSATVSSRDEIEEAREEEHKQRKEEEELARKAEQLKKEEEAARLKEQYRLEEMAKAKAALERKKRKAEKAQARAALRAQKEAEEKEKEREKKLRKKERRKSALAEDDTSVINEEESVESSETLNICPKEAETKEKLMTVTQKPRKLSQFVKQSKPKSIPMSLRNRGKRRIQQWMWVPLILLVVFTLFLLGNSNFSSKFGLQWFGL